MKLTRYDVLKKALDMACHNLMCYSANLLMDKPKPGYEPEWQTTLEEVEILEEMLKEVREND